MDNDADKETIYNEFRKAIRRDKAQSVQLLLVNLADGSH